MTQLSRSIFSLTCSISTILKKSATIFASAKLSLLLAIICANKKGFSPLKQAKRSEGNKGKAKQSKATTTTKLTWYPLIFLKTFPNESATNISFPRFWDHKSNQSMNQSKNHSINRTIKKSSKTFKILTISFSIIFQNCPACSSRSFVVFICWRKLHSSVTGR